MGGSQFLVVFSTAGSMEEASRIAEALVQERLVACVNLLPGIQSIYRWKGQVQKDQEVLMILKTMEEKLEDVKKAVRALHSYETPEFITLPIQSGTEDYLLWIEQSVKGNSR